MKNKLAATATAAALIVGMPSLAFAHATSIGYANAGPGAVAIWLGTYSSGHGASHLEGSMNLVGVNGNSFASTTIAFSLAAGDPNGSGTWASIAGYTATKPAGLVDGTTNFFGCSSAGALTAADCNAQGQTGLQPTHWQGAVFAGLTPGDYQFTYVPIANPTAEWSVLNPNMNGVFTITGAVIDPNAVPVPATLSLLGAGLGLTGLFSRRRRRSK